MTNESEQDESLNDSDDQQILIDAAIVDADNIADQQLISNEKYEHSVTIQP